MSSQNGNVDFLTYGTTGTLTLTPYGGKNMVFQMTTGDYQLAQNSVYSFYSVGSGAITNTMRLTGGKVGIRTATPSQELEVSGNMNVTKSAYIGHNLAVTGNTTLTSGNLTLVMPGLKKLDGVTGCANGDVLKWETGGRIYCG